MVCQREAQAALISYRKVQLVVSWGQGLNKIDHTELDAQLDETAWRGALEDFKHDINLVMRVLSMYKKIQYNNIHNAIHLLHAIISKNVNIITRAPRKPV